MSFKFIQRIQNNVAWEFLDLQCFLNTLKEPFSAWQQTFADHTNKHDNWRWQKFKLLNVLICVHAKGLLDAKRHGLYILEQTAKSKQFVVEKNTKKERNGWFYAFQIHISYTVGKVFIGWQID